MSDRIAVMYEGRILQVGSPGDIYERPRTRFVADFVGQMNLLEGRLVGFSGETATVEVPGSGRIAGTVVGSLASGAAVTVAVRPERIAFAGERAGSTMGEPNRLVGNVVETTYLGTHSQFAVRLGSAQTITVHRQNVGDAAAPRIGEAVEMAFAVASTMILPSE